MKKKQEEKDMAERDFVKEINEIKTAVLGYDREEVLLYIKELVNYYEKKNEEEIKGLYLEKMQLTAENAGLKSQVSTHEEIYAELAARMDRINQSVEKHEEADRAQSAELERYRSNEIAIRNMAAEAKEQAEEILEHAEASAKAILNNANIEKDRILSEAGIERRKILKEAEEKQKEILAEAGRQMDVILVKTKEKVEKEQKLYYRYRDRLEVIKNGLDTIFSECPPDDGEPGRTAEPQPAGQKESDTAPEPQPAGQKETVTAPKPQLAGQKETVTTPEQQLTKQAGAYGTYQSMVDKQKEAVPQETL